MKTINFLIHLDLDISQWDLAKIDPSSPRLEHVKKKFQPLVELYCALSSSKQFKKNLSYVSTRLFIVYGNGRVVTIVSYADWKFEFCWDKKLLTKLFKKFVYIRNISVWISSRTSFAPVHTRICATFSE